MGSSDPFAAQVLLAVAFAGAVWMLAAYARKRRALKFAGLATATVLDQMQDAVMILDLQRRISALNAAAERMLGVTVGSARCLAIEQVVPALAAPDAPVRREIALGTGAGARRYAVRCSPLLDERRVVRGELVVFHDITDDAIAHAEALERQRAAATLHERRRLARELHDNLGQVLAFVKMQAQAARNLLARDRPAEADVHLARLTSAAQEAHVSVREHIGRARAGVTNRAFLASLSALAAELREATGLTVQLEAPAALGDHPFEPPVEAELLSIVQEALTNVRRHARALAVHVEVALVDGRVETTVRDDGAGFDPPAVARAGGRFGLRIMRERAAEAGGTVRVWSAPGCGTEIAISVPLREDNRESAAG